MPVCCPSLIRDTLKGLLCFSLIATATHAQQAARRPHTKIITRNAAATERQETLVGIVGQVSHPGTYRFATPPTLQQLATAAGGMTETASTTVRVFRNDHELQRLAFQSGAQDLLQSGDLIVVDQQMVRTKSEPSPESAGVQLAFLGVMEHPVVVKVANHQARPEVVVDLLGQSPDAATRMKVVPPPGRQYEPPAAAANSPSTPLVDGTVLIFERSRIQQDFLPASMPEIVNCAFLPDTSAEPDIVGYSADRVPPLPIIEAVPRMQPGEETVSADPEPEAANSLHLVPPPPVAEWDSFADSPAPIPGGSDKPPAFSTAGRSGGSSAPVARVPFSGGKGAKSQVPRRPAEESRRRRDLPADAKEPAWQQITNSRVEMNRDLPAEDIDNLTADGGIAESKPFSGLQMSIIIACAGVLVGLALIIRRWQDAPLPVLAAPAGRRHPQRGQSHQRQSILHASNGNTLAAPHFQQLSPPAPEPLELRRQRFHDLVRNELATLEEPLALRTGLHWMLNSDHEAIRRTDAAAEHESRPHVPLARPQIAQIASVEAPLRQFDPPHADSVPAPHARAGAGSPVERALRQLEGGRT